MERNAFGEEMIGYHLPHMILVYPSKLTFNGFLFSSSSWLKSNYIFISEGNYYDDYHI